MTKTFNSFKTLNSHDFTLMSKDNVTFHLGFFSFFSSFFFFVLCNLLYFRKIYFFLMISNINNNEIGK